MTRSSGDAELISKLVLLHKKAYKQGLEMRAETRHASVERNASAHSFILKYYKSPARYRNEN